MIAPCFTCLFYPALYILSTFIQLLVPNLSLILSLNLSKKDLKFHPVQSQHFILWAHLWYLCVPPSSCMQQYTFFQYIHAHKTLVHIVSMYRLGVFFSRFLYNFNFFHKFFNTRVNSRHFRHIFLSLASLGPKKCVENVSNACLCRKIEKKV